MEGLCSGDSVPRSLGFIALMPSQMDHVCAGPGLKREPQPGLAPESALRLLPSRALSHAPAACIVSTGRILRKRRNKKSLIFAALSDMYDNAHGGCRNSGS